MQFDKLDLEGVWIGKSQPLIDIRGSFREWFKLDEFGKSSGIQFNVVQSNCSTSQKNVMRGIHYSSALSGQDKWVTCIKGSILDVVVDLRATSKNFGKSVLINLKASEGNSVYIPAGFGHGFLSLENDTMIIYNLSKSYEPKYEYAINLFDETLNINWPNVKPILSMKDHQAPKFNQIFKC